MERARSPTASPNTEPVSLGAEAGADAMAAAAAAAAAASAAGGGGAKAEPPATVEELQKKVYASRAAQSRLTQENKYLMDRLVSAKVELAESHRSCMEYKRELFRLQELKGDMEVRVRALQGSLVLATSTGAAAAVAGTTGEAAAAAAGGGLDSMLQSLRRRSSQSEV